MKLQHCCLNLLIASELKGVNEAPQSVADDVNFVFVNTSSKLAKPYLSKKTR